MGKESGQKSLTLDILPLLESCARLSGLRVCYHDYLLRIELPYEYTVHESAYCLEVKREKRGACGKFCGADGEVDRCISDYPEGWLHFCPFGCLKIAAGVYYDGILAGVLFAQSDEGAPVKPEAREAMIEGQWAQDRLRIVHAVADEIGRKLRPESARPGLSRRVRIMRYIEQSMADNPRLEGLGRELSLSPSRAGHLVDEIFGQSFSDLLRQVRCTRAALLLSATSYPVSEIALRLGFTDQSHFIRTFKKQFEVTPLVYRKRSGRGA